MRDYYESKKVDEDNKTDAIDNSEEIKTQKILVEQLELKVSFQKGIVKTKLDLYNKSRNSYNILNKEYLKSRKDFYDYYNLFKKARWYKKWSMFRTLCNKYFNWQDRYNDRNDAINSLNTIKSEYEVENNKLLIYKEDLLDAKSRLDQLIKKP